MDAPVTGLNDPALQLLHTEAPTPENFPVGQRSHVEESVSAENLPASQLVQTAPFTKVPGPHGGMHVKTVIAAHRLNVTDMDASADMATISPCLCP